jgi:hypothetical protein
MIKKLLFFLFFTANVTLQGQTKYGILVKTVLSPFMGWNGSHSITIGNKSINKGSNFEDVEVIEYDFFYVADNPTSITCLGGKVGNKDDSDCKTLKSIGYDKETFTSGSFYGCIADSEIMGIYLPQPINTTVCKQNLITLTRGWNWQYSYDGIIWNNFPNNYQAKNAISFKLEDLPNYIGKLKLYIHTGYQNQFTDFIQYDIIPCSPNLVGEPLKVNTLCSYSTNGQVTFTFDRDITDSERFSLNIFDITIPTKPRLVDEINIYSAGFPHRKFTYSGLAKGEYFLRYQTFIGAQETSTADSPSFTISNPPVFSFQALEGAPNCHDDFRIINIIPSGGTLPYYYKINTDPEIEFTAAITIQKNQGITILK